MAKRVTVSSAATSTDVLPWGTTPDGELTPTAAVVGAVLGTIAVFALFPLAVLGIVLSCMGLNRINTDLVAARRLLAWSWLVLAGSAAVPLVMLLVVALFAI